MRRSKSKKLLLKFKHFYAIENEGQKKKNRAKNVTPQNSKEQFTGHSEYKHNAIQYTC